MKRTDHKNYLCIVDFHSKLTVIKKAEGISTGSLILACKAIFLQYGFPNKMSEKDNCHTVENIICGCEVLATV